MQGSNGNGCVLAANKVIIIIENDYFPFAVFSLCVTWLATRLSLYVLGPLWRLSLSLSAFICSLRLLSLSV